MSAPELILLFKLLIKLLGSLLVLLAVATVLANLVFGGSYETLRKKHPNGRTKSPSSNPQTPKD